MIRFFYWLSVILLFLVVPSVSNAAKRVLFIGDSVTDGGWGNSCGEAVPAIQRNHSDLNHLYGHSFMMLCAAHYQSQYPDSGFVFLNRGISGNDLSMLEQRWKQDVLDERPDVLSVLVGTNDIHYFLSDTSQKFFDVDRWEIRLRTLLDAARRANPMLKLVVCTPFAAKAGWVGEAADFCQRRQLIRMIGETLSRIAVDYDALLLRFDRLFSNLENEYSSVPVSHWIWDGIHPTAAGHRRMADMWIDRVSKVGILP